MRNKILNQQKGFTLVETIVALSIGLSIFFAVFNFGQSIFSFNSVSQRNLSAQSDARRVLKTIVRELRSTSPSSLGSYPVAQATTNSLVFFADVDDDAHKERIRYFLDGTNLKRGVINPSGSPLTYNPANESIETMVRDVANGVEPIFQYFDSGYTGSGAALAEPIVVTAVRLVRINIKIEADSNKPIGPIQVSSQVFLRNLKDNL